MRREGQTLAFLQDAGYLLADQPGDLTPVQQAFCAEAHIWVLQQKNGVKPEEVYTTDELAEMREEAKRSTKKITQTQLDAWKARKADIAQRYAGNECW